MSAPYYRMFPREWDDGTAPLTLEEEGALLRICNAINSRGAPLPDDEAGDREMMHRCRVSKRKWRLLKAALVEAGKITIKDGKIYQDRALAEVDHRALQYAERAENGAAGGRKKAENGAKTPRKFDENSAKTPRKSLENDTGSNQNSDLGLAKPEPEPEPEPDNKKNIADRDDPGDPAPPRKSTPRIDRGYPLPVSPADYRPWEEDEAFCRFWLRMPQKSRKRSSLPKAFREWQAAIRRSDRKKLHEAIAAFFRSPEFRTDKEFVPAVDRFLREDRAANYLDDQTLDPERDTPEGVTKIDEFLQQNRRHLAR